MSSVNFTANTSGYLGGGASLRGGQLVSVNFDDNEATDAGGGLHVVKLASDPRTLSYIGGRISGNSAADGAGLHCTVGGALEDLTVEDNTATGGGGGLWMWGAGNSDETLLASNLSVLGNTAAVGVGSISADRRGSPTPT